MNKLLALFGTLVLLLSACSQESNVSSEAVASKDIDIANLEFAKIEKNLITDVVECTGRIDVPPNQRAAIYAPVGGNINKIRVLPGDKVNVGQVLFSLSHQDIIKIQEDYLIAMNEEILNQANYERKAKLFEANSASEKDFNQSRRDMEVARAKLASLKAQLEVIGIAPATLSTRGIQSVITIKAPISGFISQVEAVSGSYVNMNSLIMTVVNTDHKHVELDVYSDNLASLQHGQKVRFHTAGGEKEYVAEIYLVGKEVDEEKRTVAVHAHLHGEGEEELIVGSYLYAGILVNADSVYSVPESAVVKVNDKSYILLKQGETIIPAEVNLGRVFKGYIEVVNPDSLLNKEFLAKDAYYFYQ